MKKQLAALSVVVALSLMTQQSANAHCQIPCGIYDDATRFTLMLEDVTTIEKSMAQIVVLNAAASPDNNQAVRWVENKEQHADKLAETITYYFMTQRVKPAAEGDEAAQVKYLEQITLLHKMLILTMKTKQTSDSSHCTELRTLIEAFRTSYMGPTESHVHEPAPAAPAIPVAK